MHLVLVDHLVIPQVFVTLLPIECRATQSTTNRDRFDRWGNLLKAHQRRSTERYHFLSVVVPNLLFVTLMFASDKAMK